MSAPVAGQTGQSSIQIGEGIGSNFSATQQTVLRTYEGQTFLHSLLQEIVSSVDEDDKRLNLVEIILDSTGVVSGEFGMREAYQRKKTEIAPWLEDERYRIRLFAERYTRSLDRQIAAEQRRAQEDVEMRRREYDDDEADSND